MGKLGGILLAVALGLSACAAPGVTAPSAEPPHEVGLTKSGATIELASIKVKDSAMPAFAEATKTIKGYEHLTPEALSSIARELCEHYAGGFTTEDLRKTNAHLFGKASGDALAKVGEAAKATVCAD